MSTDILITDYSSIVTDFILTERPIIFYFFDYEDYINHSRKFYYDLLSILPGPFAYDEWELYNLLLNIDWFQDPNYIKRYQAFINMFHEYKDGRSCLRLNKKLQEADK